MNNYLFLDIDGVLNSEEYAIKINKLVLSSWVKHAIEADEDYNPWFDPSSSELFALYNKIINPERIKFIRCDVLEEFDGQRQDFIEQYLEDYPYDKYVAVDDTESHYHPNCEYVVFTNANIGITEQDAVQLLIKLNRN